MSKVESIKQDRCRPSELRQKPPPAPEPGHWVPDHNYQSVRSAEGGGQLKNTQTAFTNVK